MTSKADEEKEGNTEGNASSSSLRDYASDGSSSLSPPVLLPLQDVNSDFEETIEDPPDLELYHMFEDVKLMNSETEPCLYNQVIQTENILMHEFS